MSVLVQNLGDFLKVLIQSFNLSTMFPAVLFVVLIYLLVLPIVPIGTPIRQSEFWATLNTTPVAAVFVVLIAYLLDAANYKIIRFFVVVSTFKSGVDQVDLLPSRFGN